VNDLASASAGVRQKRLFRNRAADNQQHGEGRENGPPPFLQNGTLHYVAGMYTCAFSIAAGWYTFFVLLREAKRSRRASSVHA
jgi:hypothetical protein